MDVLGIVLVLLMFFPEKVGEGIARGKLAYDTFFAEMALKAPTTSWGYEPTILKKAKDELRGGK